MGRRKKQPAFTGIGEAERREWAARLQRLRKISHLSQEELASQLGLGRTAVANWETGRAMPDLVCIPALCRVLNVTPAMLLWDTAPLSDEELALLRLYRQLDTADQKTLQTVAHQLSVAEEERRLAQINTDLLRLPLAEDTVSAGVNMESFEGSCNMEYVHRTALTQKTDFLFRVNGNSMEPDYPDESIVMMQTATSLQPGETGVFQVDGSLYFKEYRTDGLHSLNPAYKTMVPGDYEDFRVIGRVIGMLAKDDWATQEEIRAFEASSQRRKRK